MQYPYPPWPPKFNRIAISSPTVGESLHEIASPINRLWVISLHFKFVTDANAADRLCLVSFGGNTGVSQAVIPPVTQVASTTRTYLFTAGVGAGAILPNSEKVIAPLGTSVILEPGGFLNINVDNIQVGDQLSLAEIWVGKYTAAFN